ncbi:4,5-DOPA dioxygenase extradiol [Mycobacterium sp. shizuoka-1]|uniref:4,5-DOPA-extradiol-dioxygenase n=1 Tax=Mycobacterium sp. shizuoka-1 TaxID=2039281 RepID=UPI000C073DDF|nr:4,5-DOPA dioxygenase extradiol [Mycobacterium sp. shizuoka-1]
MPAAFIGHGSPMNALELNRYTAAWRAFGQSVRASHGNPRAILVVSAHWYINATAVTAMAVPRTIHDFYGFPAELFDVQYPAPGLPELADEIADVVKPTWVGADIDSWGIDHGTWSVLVHAFPDASIPVVQLAVNADKPLDYHLELGAKLAALRERGVLILGSGNVVHNLAGMDPALGDRAFDWAQRFDDHAREQLLSDPGDAVALREHADYRAAVPTPDHFLPLLYLAGLAAVDGGGLQVLTDGCAYGSLSMTSYLLGLEVMAPSDDDGGAAAPARGVPVDESNI